MSPRRHARQQQAAVAAAERVLAETGSEALDPLPSLTARLTLIAATVEIARALETWTADEWEALPSQLGHAALEYPTGYEIMMAVRAAVLRGDGPAEAHRLSCWVERLRQEAEA